MMLDMSNAKKKKYWGKVHVTHNTDKNHGNIGNKM